MMTLTEVVRTVRGFRSHHFGMPAIALLICHSAVARADLIEFAGTLSGSQESPAVVSTGTGTADVWFNTGADTLRVIVNFSDLTSPTIASHIHAATLFPFSGNAGVATTVPTFPGFPLGVTSGSYDQTFDLSLASSY